MKNKRLERFGKRFERKIKSIKNYCRNSRLTVFNKRPDDYFERRKKMVRGF